MIMNGLCYGDYTSYYKFIYGDCLSHIYSIVIFLSITVAELMFSDVSQWIKEYFDHLNDNFDENTSQNHTKYQYCRYMDCVIFDLVLMCSMSGIWMIYFVYRLTNYLKFQPMTIFYHLMQIIIVLIVCSKHYIITITKLTFIQIRIIFHAFT